MLNKSLFEGEAHLNSFSGTNIKRLDHFIPPTLVEDRPDIVLIQIEPNNITHNTVKQINVKDIMNPIIDIEKKCLPYCVKEVIMWSIFMKKQFKLTRAIRHINDLLRHKFKRIIINNFHFMNNDNITRETLWTDGLHLNNDNTHVFASNLVHF